MESVVLGRHPESMNRVRVSRSFEKGHDEGSSEVARLQVDECVSGYA